MERRTSALAAEVYDLMLTDIPPSVVDIGTDGKISMVVMPGAGTGSNKDVNPTTSGDSATAAAAAPVPVGIRLAVALVVQKVREWGDDVDGVHDDTPSPTTASDGPSVRVQVQAVDETSSPVSDSNAVDASSKGGELAQHVEKALSPDDNDKVYQLVRKRLELLMAAVVVGTHAPASESQQQQRVANNPNTSSSTSGGGGVRSAPNGPSDLIREQLLKFSLEFMVKGFTRLASGVMSFAQRDLAIHAAVFAAPPANTVSD
jgi:hypothetical protein